MSTTRLTAAEITKFRMMFEEQRKALIFSKGVMDESFHVQPEEMMDETDLTSAELEQSMRIRLRNREALFMKKIDEALRRIAAGEFGACEGCGEEIGLKRLQARPTATHCVHCKEEQERAERFHVDGRKPKSVGRKIVLKLA
ncbi:MAG TPA: TraR/DksA C4-type zinc finger protein [Bdellovibrionota bacterium]|jgi:DnaK suppressor protein|nr:TraR/DksA C4-type zinc finger protein [Bdellovibrionota bacterium]